MKNSESVNTSRQYKDTLFRALFSDGKEFLALYNAVADDHYPDDTDVTPCPNNPILARFNDVAFRIGSQIVVFFEQQSSLSKNMPLRLLRYVTDVLYSQIVDMDKLYGSAQVMIPAPKFYILYNGKQKVREKVIKLSDAFILSDSEPGLELTARIININYNNGEAALDRSASLKGYSFLIETIRNNQDSGMTRDESIAAAIDLCIKQDVLRTYLEAHYAEVIKMLNYEYDAEAERRVLQQESRQEGRAEERRLFVEERQAFTRERQTFTKERQTFTKERQTFVTLLRAQGMSDEKIAEATGRTLDEIQCL